MTLLRSAAFNVFFMGGTVLTVLAALPLLLLPPRALIAFIRCWARAMIAGLRVICGIRLEVTGLDHIPPGGSIIAAKHQSAFDTMVWLVLLPRPAYVLKKELLDIPLWGRLARHCGHLGVDRKGGGAALRALVRGAKERLEEGRPVVIFPEGTRTTPGERQSYQPGVAAMAAATGAPVVPAATDSGRFWGRRAFRKSPGVLHVSVLPALPAGMPRGALMAALEQAIETETERLMAHPGVCG
ncbi:1-acyl-sn-glycerol-3-phosphate acyltransferase [Roseomonas terrae]|jgi:1-acyl-sn-glycerol-3-phosphate acyltransferase|uniref:1-acyl-sn-glycerol-3-phosphate acyltransferase n=1 Tax=Neoroseomonas terrae TaxID=424799 RepID=A0ABS5EE10_9PROT|nr:lysophospholipid acyltransferase family protein [Neoroseomonas terrae]MBR0649253.1 1-acyl-sn-glycerol-3-phosphate acyltransferase [Neoroseomonas terrae]